MKKKHNILFVLICTLLCTAVSSAQNTSVRNADMTASDLYKRARDYQAREDWYAALELYQEALNKNPSYAEAWFALAECSYELEQYDLTVKYCDSASKYIKNRTDILNLKGFALIGLHKLEEARSIFSEVLNRFPNDVEARFGLARLDLFDGKLSTAEQYFLDALKRESKNKKALISLALIAERQGKTEQSRLYIREALRTHNGKAEVYYFAGYLAAKEGNLAEAESLIRTAVLLDGNYDKAYKLLADILFAQKRYAETADICDFRIAKNASSVSAWYLKGLSLAALGENEKALSAWQTGLSRDPQDEIMRAAFELLVFDAVELEDKRRENWAAYHIDKAEAYMEKFTAVHALYEYQRALRIQPLNVEARLAYARLLLNKGLSESYLSQLVFLKDQQRADKRVEDIIESYTSLLQNTLPLQWGIKPFYLDKTRWKTGLYTLTEDFSLYHQNAVSVSAGLLADIFNANQFVSVRHMGPAVSSYAEAFKDARTRGFDFFALMDLTEEERGINIRFDLYSAASGNKLHSTDVYRTGNDRLASALQKIRDDLTSVLPHKAKIIARRGSLVLIDYGRKDGAVDEQVFDVYKTGDTGFDGSSLDLKYDEKKRIGSLTLTAVGEDISQGEFKQNGFYDLLALGDDAVPVVKAEAPAAETVKKEKKKKSKDEAPPVEVEKRKSVLYDLIQSIR
ncbi:tetratricopeptide repeat protein [Treponema sp. HNW]|uniref:tetratricopeptide repeat protein n=1 Tax=Treponema sp. HNW TaxID=3116654 RepID=UPI003D10D37F